MPRVKNVRRNGANPLVFFDVAVKGGPAGVTDLGRVTFELYEDIAPKVKAGDVSSEPVYGHQSLAAPDPLLFQMQSVLDRRKLSATMLWRRRRWEKHWSSPSFQRLSFPQDHQRLHDPGR